MAVNTTAPGRAGLESDSRKAHQKMKTTPAKRRLAVGLGTAILLVGSMVGSALASDTVTQAITGSLSSEVGKVVEQTFGVDTFQLTPSFIDPYSQQTSRLNPTARLTIGKRISERVYLTFSRSLGTRKPTCTPAPPYTSGGNSLVRIATCIF